MEKIVNFVSLILVVLVGAYAALNINQLQAKMEETQSVMLMMAEKIGGNVNVQQSVNQNQAVEVVSPPPQAEPTAAPEVVNVPPPVQAPAPLAPSGDPGEYIALLAQAAVNFHNRYYECQQASGNCGELAALHVAAHRAYTGDPLTLGDQGRYQKIKDAADLLVTAFAVGDHDSAAVGLAVLEGEINAAINYLNGGRQ